MRLRVSAQPGLILGEREDGIVMLATTGRVRVKVDATRRPIKIGDLLVSSDKIGVAMKSQPIRAGRGIIHRSATIIGKALEPLAKGQGVILVLLSLQLELKQVGRGICRPHDDNHTLAFDLKPV